MPQELKGSLTPVPFSHSSRKAAKKITPSPVSIDGPGSRDEIPFPPGFSSIDQNFPQESPFLVEWAGEGHAFSATSASSAVKLIFGLMYAF